MQNFYSLLGEIIQAQLAANAINAPLIGQITSNIIDTLATRHGGKNVYLPNLCRQRATKKQRQILADFTGHNHDEVCQRHGITRYWLTKLIAGAKVHEKQAISQHV
ncbi:MAG: Mor transcription activator family protein [Methylovulum sp.]|nr:Mor transcription activator family protein [Methylovulum sp.]